jgi:hypothetical protein
MLNINTTKVQGQRNKVKNIKNIYVSEPSYRLENLELSLEKNEVLPAEFNAEVS